MVAGYVTSIPKRSSKAQSTCVYVSAAIEAAAGIAFALQFFIGGCQTQSFFIQTEAVDGLMDVGEVFLMLLVCFLAIKHKKYFVLPLSIIPTCAVLVFEFFGPGCAQAAHVTVDRLSVLMILIITVVGAFICCYAVGYMKGYHLHHPEFSDRTKYFLPLLIVFLGAMCGLVLSADLVWLCFFWEVTSTISFLLIGYTRTREAVDNSFKAIWMNLLGGWGIVGAIYYCGYVFGSTELGTLLSEEPALVQLPVALLAFAAFTKSAQFPFSGWLLGAMCAPTPSSTLLHSATMVKAGIYLLIRLAPAMSGSMSGAMTAYIGGFTFFIASMLAISTSDAKKVLAYSTISNLGLMVACCGIGTEETIFGAVMLLIFHSVSKSMLFQAVGAVENSIGTRDIEAWDGLILRLPKLALVLVIGILGMYTAPFGMLISKWVALKAFVDNNAILLVLITVFGSATTMFYWLKFLSKILTLRVRDKVHDRTRPLEYVSMFAHAVAVIGICICLKPIVERYIEPMMREMFGSDVTVIGTGELIAMVLLLVFIFLIPVVMFFVSRKLHERRVPAYMAGANAGDGNDFTDALGEPKHMNMSNWYMEDLFGERRLDKPAVWISGAFISVMLCLCAFGGQLL